MTQRYFVPDLPAAGGVISLSAAEARHATRVMRVSPGDPVALFDGRGRESAATVAEVSRNECHCQAAPPQAVDRELPIRLHLGIALPKGDRARDLIERLTELGVASVTPLNTARTQRNYSGSRLEKLRRAVIEASKQCGRNVLMTLEEPADAFEFFSHPADAAETRWLAHPDPAATALKAAPVGQRVLAAVGPEGGWSEEETEAAEAAGFQLIDMGRRIYRIETAAVVLAARAAI